jgi:GPH family glycoside/pentoside/hexuronide:cation symporter
MNKPDRIDTAARPHRLSLFHLFAYVFPAVPLAALGMPIVVHLPQFYASREMGLSLGATGAIFMLMRILDVFIDPMMGYWSDRWRTRWGRRRPLVLIGAPLLALGIWMTFVPGGPVSIYHLGFWLFVMYFAWSMVVIPHLSWGAELSPNYHERSRVYGWSQVATLTGFLGVLVVPAVLEQGKASETLQVMSMAVFALVMLVPSVALCVLAVPEPEVKLRTHAPLIPTLRFLLKDRAIRRVMAVDLIESTNQGARGAMFLYFTRLALGQPIWGGKLLLIYFLSGIVFVPAWIALSKRVGKHRALTFCYIYGIATAPLLFFVPSGNLAAAIGVFALTGVSYGAPAFLLRSMMADIADADTAENGAERAGIMYSFLSLTSKFGLGWSVGIAFGVLAWMGFDPHQVNAPAAIEHLRVFYIVLPILLAMLSLSVMLGYPLDEARQQRLREEIERMRRTHVSAEDIMPPGLLPGGAALASDSETVAHLAPDRPPN